MTRTEVDLKEDLALADPGRHDLLLHVAKLYGDAVGIIDTLRIQSWSEDGLTIPQLRLLWALRDEDGLPVGSLAEHLGVNPSTITGHVDRLVRQGLVRREEDSIDRRIVRNYLTDEGAVTVGAVRRIAGMYMINILKRLDDDQLARLEAALADLNRAADAARREGV
ncbi:MAG TPA: MarR family transcriptional regulator [Dehalococcoidia bacterium]|nr:MarR family transcriptional regulator [Dehalococcoidia bacterium]